MLISEVQDALSQMDARSWWHYRLPAALEARFAMEGAPARARQLRVWGLITVCFVWGTLPLDIVMTRPMWPWFLSERLLLITPVFLWAASRIGAEPTARPSLLLTVGPYCLLTLVVPLTFSLAPTFDPSMMVLAPFSMVLWVTAMVPFGMRGALCFGIFGLISGDVVLAIGFHVHHVAGQRPDIIVMCHALILLILIGRMLGEREMRRGFVSGLRLQVRADSLARSNAQLVELSNTDALTGLANRRAFDQTLVQCVANAAATGTALALLMIDIDNFKKFNDTAGHPEGDRCLATVARAIAVEVRANDFAARYGGEEFVVILPATDLAQANALAERIHTAIAVLRVYHPGLGGGGFVSISIGLAAIRPQGPANDGKALLSAADEALYAAKRAGRNRVVAADLPAAAPS